MKRKIHCRYCQARRDVSRGGICKGCGSAADQASGIKPRRSRRCPKCTDGRLVLQEINGVANCGGCGYSTHDFAGRRPVHV